MIDQLVLLGASGDLTKRLLLPAVAQLCEAGQLPAGFAIVGAAVDDWTTEQFRAHIDQGLRDHANVSDATRATIVSMLTYRSTDVTDAADVQQLLVDRHRNTLVYLALPPFLLPKVLPALAECHLTADDAIAIEKPFGTDLASAQHLNHILKTRLPHPTIFRVDHFLSNELVRRVIILRFLNRVFEPIWNAEHIERVDISWLESLALEGRAGYYDTAGAMKDMIQNHLMEVMALVLMEQPARLDADSFRAVRVEALRSVATPDPARLAATTVRARYTAGAIGDRQIPSYVDEPGVDATRGTETYAAITLEVNSPRWAGVPFTLRSGKALGADSAEIAIHFRPLPDYMLERFPGVQPNVLRLGLTEPYLCLSTTLNAGDSATSSENLEAVSPPPALSPYAHLVHHMLDSDPMLFIRGDEAEEAWRIIDPVMHCWHADEVPMVEYPAGSDAPSGGA
jgi:glucose-6-phosphate 1-dehydrogenase